MVIRSSTTTVPWQRLGPPLPDRGHFQYPASTDGGAVTRHARYPVPKAQRTCADADRGDPMGVRSQVAATRGGMASSNTAPHPHPHQKKNNNKKNGSSHTSSVCAVTSHEAAAMEHAWRVEAKVGGIWNANFTFVKIKPSSRNKNAKGSNSPCLLRSFSLLCGLTHISTVKYVSELLC